jgi:hypothetical protein
MTLLSNRQFWALLRDNAGLYARTARKALEVHQVTISRQAIKDRAEKDPDKLADIREETVEVAEDGLISLMRQNEDKRVKLEATRTFLKAQGRSKGWGDKVDITSGDKPLAAPIINFGDVDPRKPGDE